MAAAYAYAAQGGQQPKELYLLSCIDRFGVAAVLGRQTLGAKELRLMAMAENISTWYVDSQKAPEMATWARENPGAIVALERARKLAIDRGLLDV